MCINASETFRYSAERLCVKAQRTLITLYSGQSLDGIWNFTLNDADKNKHLILSTLCTE